MTIGELRALLASHSEWSDEMPVMIERVERGDCVSMISAFGIAIVDIVDPSEALILTPEEDCFDIVP